MRLVELTEKKKEEEKGTYAGYHFDPIEVEGIRRWAEDNGVPDVMPNDKMHSTLLFSRKHCPNYEALGQLEAPIDAEVDGKEIWPTKDGKHALVIRLNAPDMLNRHEALMQEHGATYDYDEYKPHITVSYDVGDEFPLGDMSDIGDYLPDRMIHAVEEYQEELTLDWQNKDK